MRAAVQRLLAPDALVAVAQPLVRLADGSVTGYEALTRMPGTLHGPQHWLKAAGQVGLRDELELACLRAVATLGTPPSGAALFVNASPATIALPQAKALLAELPDALVLELTEDVPVADYDELRRILAPYVARGVEIAVDDTGSGYASLEHVVELRPRYLKLAHRLVGGLDRDPTRQALMRAVVAFAREVGAEVVAEGVQTAAEHEVLCAADVDHAQGWLYAEPGPPWPAVRTAPRPRVVRRPAGRARQLAFDLAAATDVAGCAAVVVDHLHRRDRVLPSVYLARGNRLRCVAVRGYWQVYDGMPTGAGVIGRVFAKGEGEHVVDVSGDDGYLEAAPGVTEQLCLPLIVEGAVVGVLNVESYDALPPTVHAEVLDCAAALSARLTEVGMPGESPAQRLSRHAASLARLSGRGDRVALQAEVLSAAVELSPMSSALLAVHEGGTWQTGATGPLAPTLLALSDTSLRTVAGWVATGASAYSTGTVGGVGFPGHEVLRAAGAGTIVVLPVASPDGAAGVLLVASRRVRAPEAAEVELLELLAAQVENALLVAVSVRELRGQAERDALTGLGHHASFHDSLPVLRARAGCLAVLYVDVDHFKAVNDTLGHAVGDAVLIDLTASMSRTLRSTDRLFRIGGDEFAALAVVDDADDALGLGRRLLARVLQDTGISVSVGIAVAEPEEPDATLLARADRALYQVKHAGRADVRLLSAADPVETPARRRAL